MQVDLLGNHEDFQVIVLASLGMSTKCISRETGLSSGQVSYRCKKGSIKRSDYREGASPIAKSVIKASDELVVKQIKAALRKNLT